MANFKHLQFSDLSNMNYRLCGCSNAFVVESDHEKLQLKLKKILSRGEDFYTILSEDKENKKMNIYNKER